MTRRIVVPLPGVDSQSQAPGRGGAAGRESAPGKGGAARHGPASDADALDGRKAAVLKAVVNEYVRTAQPVGSGHVVGVPGLQVSSATVRAEMLQLEHEGDLTQPHTSAGRIPTDKGYRFFVDELGQPGQLRSGQRNEVRQFFASVSGGLEDMLESTSKLLARLAVCTAVVVEPPHEQATVRGVQVVGLHGNVGLVVAILSDGAIERRTTELPDGFEPGDLAAASARLSELMVGRSLGSAASWQPVGTRAASEGIPGEGGRRDAMLERILARAVEALAADSGEHGVEAHQVFVGGASRAAEIFDAVDTVRAVLQVLEHQYLVVTLLRSIIDGGLSVAIGSEHGYEPLAACSLVVAPYTFEGGATGTVGLLGPTRMDYRRAMATVAAIGSELSERLGDRGKSGAGESSFGERGSLERGSSASGA